MAKRKKQTSEAAVREIRRRTLSEIPTLRTMHWIVGLRSAARFCSIELDGVQWCLMLDGGSAMLRWRLTLFDSSIRRWSCVVLIAVLVAGCGGIHRLSVYAPLAPAPPESQISLAQEGYWWVIDLGDVEISVGPVVLSEELRWIVGPLILIPAFLWEQDVPRQNPLGIYLNVKAKPEAHVEFDPREFLVLLEDGQLLSPVGATPWPSSPDTKALEPVVLSEEQEWRASLLYDVSRVGLRPFTLRLGVLIVNGQVLRVPALSFEAGSLWQSS